MSRLLAHVRQIGGGRLDQRILFLHIPKCGGTSVREAIGASYGWRPGRQSRSARLDAQASWQGSRLSGTDLFAFRERLLLYELCRPHLQYIAGHYPLSETVLDEFGDDWDVITVLRDPVDRWLSEYFYNRHKRSEYFAHEMDLEEYAESRTGRISAMTYARWFSGDPSGCGVAASVDRALHNLDRLDLVGVLEHLDDFRARFRDHYGVSLRIPRLNRSPRSMEQQTAAIGPELRSKAEALCAGDMRLYRHALEMNDIG